jgi:hypothetical protein
MIILEGDIWTRWEAKRKELETRDRWELAGLFRGHEGSAFRRADKRVLYVGKATAGLYDPRPENENFFGCNRRAFWSFARRLNKLTGGNPGELENIAWSNLCKIGAVIGNPDDALVDAQAVLAVETLRQEWVQLRPTLVVCVAEGWHEELVYRAFNVTQNQGDGFEVVPVSGSEFWRRPAIDGMPAFLWMKHPQGKRREYIDAAEAIAKAMLMSEGI